MSDRRMKDLLKIMEGSSNTAKKKKKKVNESRDMNTLRSLNETKGDCGCKSYDCGICFPIINENKKRIDENILGNVENVNSYMPSEIEEEEVHDAEPASSAEQPEGEELNEDSDQAEEDAELILEASEQILEIMSEIESTVREYPGAYSRFRAYPKGQILSAVGDSEYPDAMATLRGISNEIREEANEEEEDGFEESVSEDEVPQSESDFDDDFDEFDSEDSSVDIDPVDPEDEEDVDVELDEPEFRDEESMDDAERETLVSQIITSIESGLAYSDKYDNIDYDRLYGMPSSSLRKIYNRVVVGEE